jgi:fibrillarin-like rRNA methylase
MRQIVPYLLAALIRVAFVPVSYASVVAESTELYKIISQNEDTNMTPNNLAFFLATHNYDATPKNGYVQVKIDCTIYKVMPNGSKPGLADLSVIS